MAKNILFYLSMLPLTFVILSVILACMVLAATGVAGIIIGLANAIVPTPTGL